MEYRMSLQRVVHDVIDSLMLATLGAVMVMFSMSFAKQEFTLSMASGPAMSLHDGSLDMVATLPPSFSDDFVVPMTRRADGTIVSQEGRPLPWLFAGNSSAFQIQAAGKPGDYSEVILVRSPSGKGHIIDRRIDEDRFVVQLEPEAGDEIVATFRYQVVDT
jgi:hypothetical protein